MALSDRAATFAPLRATTLLTTCRDLIGRACLEVPLGEIDLGSWDFWLLDDDLRDGAFATLRRAAPISLQPECNRIRTPQPRLLSQ